MGQERTDRKRAEKAARREAKIARKEANVVEEKKRKLGNGLIAIMIFGVLAVMFVSVWCLNYFSREASIESYIKNNGGKDVYGSIMVDTDTTANITAEKNKINMIMEVKCDKGDVKERTEYYKGDDGTELMKYMASYFLTTIKPQVRGFSAEAVCKTEINGKEVNSVSIDYSEAKKIMEDTGATAEDAEE